MNSLQAKCHPFVSTAEESRSTASKCEAEGFHCNRNRIGAEPTGKAPCEKIENTHFSNQDHPSGTIQKRWGRFEAKPFHPLPWSMYGPVRMSS
jgi:hypothetical protein